MYFLKNLLELMSEKNASDLHLSIGSPPRMRLNGDLVPIEGEKLTLEQITKLLQEYISDDKLQEIKNGTECDFTIGIPGISRYRVNAFKQRGNIVAAFRRLPFDIPHINNLGLPDAVLKLTTRRKGLILITGGTGSGKSTTMASLIQKISHEINGHIITIEDPIEYLYEHSKSLVNQREIGSDTHSFQSSLKSVLRQDPDVVSIGELRDSESMNAALTIAETGHLVLGTLHTNNAAGTVTRLISAFPSGKQDIIRTTLSMNLISIISQQLIPNLNKGRTLALEILMNTPSIKALIRENNIHQIDNYLLSGKKDGMIKMDDSILDLYKDKVISKDEALNFAINNTEMLQRIEGLTR